MRKPVSVWSSIGLPEPVKEYRFHPTRRWRFDWAWPDHKVALEVEGGAYINGRHTRGAGFIHDMQKYNEAALHGWLLIRVTPKQFYSDAPLLVQRAIEARKAA